MKVALGRQSHRRENVSAHLWKAKPKVLPSPHWSTRQYISALISLELTFSNQKKKGRKNMLMCPSLFLCLSICVVNLKDFFFLTLKFSMIVWCDRCENGSGQKTWVMLSSQCCAVIVPELQLLWTENLRWLVTDVFWVGLGAWCEWGQRQRWRGRQKWKYADVNIDVWVSK